MKSDVLLDTNVVIDFLRGLDAANSLFRALQRPPGVSAVTLTEIIAGLATRREEAAAGAFFADVNLIAIIPDIARRAGVFVRHYGASHAVDIPDALIAATAEHHGLKLATLNVKHFPMIPKLKRAY